MDMINDYDGCARSVWARAGAAGTAGTVLAVPLFTTCLIISRRGLQHTHKWGCGTHVGV